MRRMRISVLNNDYYIKTDADEEYMSQIANYLEGKFKEASPNLENVVAPRQVLLATLKIADEFFKLKREFEEFKKSAEERSKSLVDMLDNSLNYVDNSVPQNEGKGEGNSRMERGDPFK